MQQRFSVFLSTATLWLGAWLASCTLPTLQLKQDVDHEPPLPPPSGATPTTEIMAEVGNAEQPTVTPVMGPITPINVDPMPCSTNNGGCAAMAQCMSQNGIVEACVCPAGYEGNGFGESGCTPTRTCMNDNGGCDTLPMATCSEAGGNNVTCVCPIGYSGSGLGPDGCIDIDECASNNGGCDTTPKATCANTPGGRACSCPSGYIGTGVGEAGCSDTNECANNNGGCDTVPMATCSNTTGGRSCTCPSGYTGSGVGDTGCTDINECTTNNGGCDTVPMATCANTSGGRTCSCPSGYTGSGIGDYGCSDINECTTENGGCDTSPMATCTNTTGGRTCECPLGRGTKWNDGVSSSRPGDIQCYIRVRTSSGAVWDYQNNVSWQGETPATYPSCRSTYNGRSNGVTGEACSWAEAKAYCASYSSSVVWRLPTRAELSSIVIAANSPTISPESFPDAPSTKFWTSTGYDALNSWFIDFSDGTENWGADTTGLDVRCVRDWD